MGISTFYMFFNFAFSQIAVQSVVLKQNKNIWLK